MLIMYISPGCASCRKARAWLTEHNIPFKERNIFSALLKDDEIKTLLMRSENGTDDIISKRAKVIVENNIDVEDMSMPELIEFVKENPSILKRPILIDEKRFVVGYDDDEITTFIPPELRSIAALHCNPSCPVYKRCGESRNYEQVAK